MRRLLPIAALALLGLPLLAVPASAGAARIGPQVERRAPHRFPADLPGCRPRCVQGRTIPDGWSLLSRTVTLAPGERRATLRFRCRGGRRFRTFGFLESPSADVVLQIPSDQLPYTNRTRVRVVAERNLEPLGNPSSGTVYALCVPR